jgi:hypothetical protein
MRELKRILCSALLLVCTLNISAQTQANTEIFTVTITNQQSEILEGAVVEILNGTTKKLIKSAVTNKNGVSVFYMALAGEYILTPVLLARKHKPSP